MLNRITHVKLRVKTSTCNKYRNENSHSDNYPNTRSKVRALTSITHAELTNYPNTRIKARERARTKARAKSKYMRRDEHEIFFRPSSKEAQQERAKRARRKRKTKKVKSKILTDKERAEFARRHWEEHYGKGAEKAENSDVWAAAAYIPGSGSMKADTPTSQSTPQPPTTTSASTSASTTTPIPHHQQQQLSIKIHGHFNPNINISTNNDTSDSEHLHNLSPAMSPIVSELDKTSFFLNETS